MEHISTTYIYNFKKEESSYRIEVEWTTQDQCFVARVPRIQICSEHGSSLHDVIIRIAESIELYLKCKEELNAQNQDKDQQ